MAKTDYSYGLYMLKSDGQVLGCVPIQADWEPACQGAALSAMRCGKLPPSLSLAETGVIEPIWSSEQGEPFAVGFRVRLVVDGYGEFVEEFPLLYFQSLARSASSIFIQQGKLTNGEVFNFALTAQPETHDTHTTDDSAFSIEESDSMLAIAESSLADFMERARPQQKQYDGDMAVFIPQSVLDECSDSARIEVDRETGGVLIGHLHRDDATTDIFCEVSAQIPATHTRSQLASLTFTSETWSAVQAAISLRKSDEIVVGWWHSHPGAMFGDRRNNKEEQEKTTTSAISTVFLSLDDVALTRTCFPAAYSLALVFGETTSGEQSFGLFAPKKGILVQRGFHVLRSEGASAGETSTEQDNIKDSRTAIQRNLAARPGKQPTRKGGVKHAT